MHWIHGFMSLMDEDDYLRKENFVMQHELVERVLEEMQRPGHTTQTRNSMLRLMNAFLVKSLTEDNELENDELVDAHGEYVVFTQADVSLECYKVFYHAHGDDIIDALSGDSSATNETLQVDLEKFRQRFGRIMSASEADLEELEPTPI